MRIVGHCVMPNHWHLVVWPQDGKERQVSEFLHWLTVTHAQRWHAHRHTWGTGHSYQGRFKSFPVELDEHLNAILPYVERKRVRAHLVQRAQDWHCSSVGRCHRGDDEACGLMSPWPITRPSDWLRRVNRAEGRGQIEALRRCVQRGQPYGSEPWRLRITVQLGLESTFRPRGKPRKPAR